MAKKKEYVLIRLGSLQQVISEVSGKSLVNPMLVVPNPTDGVSLSPLAEYVQADKDGNQSVELVLEEVLFKAQPSDMLIEKYEAKLLKK